MREDWRYDESGEWLHAKINDWIYIGADIFQKDFSKIGKTTVGLDIRHTSSQSPGYFIYAAYNIKSGNVHAIESELLRYLEFMLPGQRLPHFSTGSISECFWTNPNYMVGLVENFIEQNYGPSVTYENAQGGAMSRYQCPGNIYNRYDPRFNYIWPVNRSSIEVPNLSMSASQYVTGNQVEYEIDLGDGYYFDHDTCTQRYRDPYSGLEDD